MCCLITSCVTHNHKSLEDWQISPIHIKLKQIDSKNINYKIINDTDDYLVLNFASADQLVFEFDVADEKGERQFPPDLQMCGGVETVGEYFILPPGRTVTKTYSLQKYDLDKSKTIDVYYGVVFGFVRCSSREGANLILRKCQADDGPLKTSSVNSDKIRLKF